jgi:acyl-CoA reductase-like NAD-dependent aldehyde dehydrogenase
MPHCGFKQSTYGTDRSSYGIEDYTVVKHVMAKSAD